MFKFFKKKMEQRKAADERSQSFKKVLAQFENGSGSRLETALVLYLVTKDQESLTRFLMTFGESDVWLLNKSTDERLDDPAVAEGSDGRPYVAAFTSQERATSAAAAWKLSNRPSGVSTLELVFALTPEVGIVLNADDPHVQWTFTPEHVSNLRALFEGGHSYEVGGIYSIWSQGTFRAAKLLAKDDRGVHLRVYTNTFSYRPKDVDPASLTLDSSDVASPVAIGHMPLTRASFLAMGPKLIVTVPVGDDELEGYKMWAEAKGGYFGTGL